MDALERMIRQIEKKQGDSTLKFLKSLGVSMFTDDNKKEFKTTFQLLKETFDKYDKKHN